MTYFKVVSKHLPVRTKNGTENLRLACFRAVIWIRDSRIGEYFGVGSIRTVACRKPAAKCISRISPRGTITKVARKVLQLKFLLLVIKYFCGHTPQIWMYCIAHFSAHFPSPSIVFPQRQTSATISLLYQFEFCTPSHSFSSSVTALSLLNLFQRLAFLRLKEATSWGRCWLLCG